MLCAAALSVAAQDAPKPTLYIIGDSTVNNHTAVLLGWGDPIKSLFDLSKINVENKARGGRSSRTFITEGLWDQIVAVLKPGDFVLMQFGHNDGGPLGEGRARASLKGTGDESQEVTIVATGKKEIVYSYGWYMRKYVSDAKAKGATPIVLSLVPRNMWKDGKVLRGTNDYVKWARDAAQAGGAQFIDLNDIVAKHYEELGEEKVKTQFFAEDHTHTTVPGAELNAQSVVEGIRGLEKCPLAAFLKPR